MPSRFKVLLLSLLAGIIYPLGFAPFAWWPLSIVSVALIFHLWSRADRTTALWSAGIYGVGVYGTGVSWVYVSMVNFGNMVPAMAVIAVILFALFLSLYFVVPVFFYTLISSRVSERHRVTILLPILWVVFEWLRGTLFTGFAWLYLGYTAVDTWFAAWATVAGVCAVSMLLAGIAGQLCYVWQAGKPAYIRSILLLAGLAAVSWGLNSVRWVEQSGEALNVTMIQADIPLAEKWQPENRNSLMQTYLAASRAVENADLIVWPEAAIPMVLDRVPTPYIKDLRGLSSSLVFGVVERKVDASNVHLYNSLAVIDAQAGDEEPLQTYKKRHLVPFGEFFPLKPLLGWIFDTFNIPMSDFSSGGETQGNVSVNGINMVPTICYEDAYPEDWRRQIADSQIILNISEDAWFGDSLAPHQRLQMARMRAIEFQRSVVRSSNSGLSTIIDERGNIDAISPQFQPAIFSSPVFPMQGETPYAKYGQWPLWLWIVLMIGFVMLQSRNGIDERGASPRLP